MLPDARAAVPESLRRRYVAAGHWTDEQLSTRLRRTARRYPDATMLVDLTDAGVRVLRFGDVAALVDHLCAHWRRAGLVPGDQVLLQASNSRDLVVSLLACFQSGLVAVPVIDLFREHEIGQTLREVAPRAVVVAPEHRGFDLPSAWDRALRAAGHHDIRSRLVLGEARAGWSAFRAAVADPGAIGAGPADVDPDQPAAILLTSGSAAAPKAVVHSGRTLLAEVAQMRWSKGLGWRTRGYVGVPLAHLAGLLNAVLIPASLGSSVVLSRPRTLSATAREILDHEVTDASGPTTLLDAVVAVCGDQPPMHLRRWWAGGFTISAARLSAAEAIGLRPFRTYGMTELPTVTQSSELDSRSIRVETDGRIAPGVECEAVDAERRPLPPGEEGELRVRGPERMLGYLSAAQTAESTDDAGWFYTGDLGTVSAEGCVTVSGRLKDIINRGGEKFSARDIEDVLERHRAVSRAAVVPGPDPRFGEVPVAFVSFGRDGSTPTAEELADFLHAQGLAAAKVPQEWHVVSDWPELSIGKIDKLRLREQVRHAE